MKGGREACSGQRSKPVITGMFGLLFCLAVLAANATAVIASPSSVSAANYYEMTANPWYVSLGVKGYQQTTDYTCGPAAVMSLLHWYGRLDASELNAATELRIAREMGTGDLQSRRPGTSVAQMTNWLERNGFRVASGEDGTLELLQKFLKKKIPVLVEWIDWGGHWVVATGYHAAYESPTRGPDTIFFADPASHWANPDNPDGISSFNAWRFRDMWLDVQYLNPGHVTRRVYIIAVPAKPRQ
ncbi:MAG: hypothetical protein GYA36_08625 [Veillonellaceae bacterium]|nr:hypothetical protein [Veillonellaceae bacterium]